MPLTNSEIQAQADRMVGSNSAGLVYMWGSTGIAYNEDMVADRLGDDAPTDSWSLILDPENAAKLEDCGIAILDAPTDVLPNVMTYLGYPGTSMEKSHFEAAGDALSAIRPYLRYINSSQSINDIAMGISVQQSCGLETHFKQLTEPRKQKTGM